MGEKRVTSIRTKTMLAILPLLIVVMVILSWISYHYSYIIIERELNEQIHLKLETNLQSFKTDLNTHKTIGETLARLAEKGGESLTKQQYAAFLQNAITTNPHTLGAGIWYEPFRYKADVKYFGPYAYKDKGQSVYTEDYETAEYNFPSQEWYKMATNTTKPVVWTDPYYDDVTKITMITAAMPFYDQNKKFSGMATADMAIDDLQKTVTEIKVGEKGWAFLLNRSGTYIAHRDNEKVMKVKITEDPNTAVAAIGKEIVAGKNGKATYRDGSENYRVYYAELPETGWILVVTVPESELYAELQALLWKQIVVAIIAILLVILVIIMYTKFITRNINEVKRLSDVMADGDLSQQMNISSNDEFGQMGRNFNSMINNLRSVLHIIMDNSQQVAASSEQLTASSQQTAEATEHIAQSMQGIAHGVNREIAATNETNTAINEIATHISNISQNMHTVTDMSVQTSKKAEDGNRVVTHALTQMNLISEKVGTATSVVNVLGDKSREINQIISLITGIAGQTNLLALNAAIEAARAGEQGRGFAVVADEVRKLAEQSGVAAKQISDIINEIQLETDKAVQIMDDSTHSVHEGITMVNQAEVAFREIMKAIEEISKQTSNISNNIVTIDTDTQKIVSSVKDIADFSNKTGLSIEAIASSTEEQTASMEEILGAAAMLAKLAQELDSGVNKFKL